MAFPQTYQTDGVQTVWSFDFPYLDRSHIFVTVNGAARAFTFVDDHTLKVVDLFGNPLAAGQPLVINRGTPDIVEFAVFKDAANLTADDLNRARLQVLFLVQERSGGLAGSVGTVVQLLSNEIETISGSLDTLTETQGVLLSGLATLDALAGRVTATENGAQALQDQINQEIANRNTADSQLSSRVDSLSVTTTNMSASFNSQINLLQTSQESLANRTDTLSAKIDALAEDSGGDNSGEDALAASIISSAVSSVKADNAQGLKITALSEQITQLQSQIGDDLATVVQDMKTEIDSVDGKVTNLQAQYTLKAQVTRADGTVVMGGIGVAATANDDYEGSQVVLMGDSILFADPNNVNGSLIPFLEAGLVDGSPTLVVPSNVVGDQTLPGRVLVDGSVQARSIAANTITGDKLVAGSITTDKLSVGLGSNLLPESTFAVTSDGTTPKGWSYSQTAAFNHLLGHDLNTQWTLAGGHTAFVQNTTTNGDTNIASSFAMMYSDAFAVTPGTRYEFSAYVTRLFCAADVGLYWYDANNALFSSSGFTGFAGASLASGNDAGGTTLSQYTRIGGIVAAPANAATARLVVRKSLHSAAASSYSYVFVTQPMVAETTSSATRLSPYGPSGQGTLVTASGISTPNLSALSASIGTLRTATTGQRMELSDAGLAVYDANNVQVVFIGVF